MTISNINENNEIISKFKSKIDHINEVLKDVLRKADMSFEISQINDKIKNISQNKAEKNQLDEINSKIIDCNKRVNQCLEKVTLTKQLEQDLLNVMNSVDKLKYDLESSVDNNYLTMNKFRKDICNKLDNTMFEE